MITLKRTISKSFITHLSSASLAFVRGIHRWPEDSPIKGPVTRKMFPFEDVIPGSTGHVHTQDSNLSTLYLQMTWHITVLEQAQWRLLDWTYFFQVTMDINDFSYDFNWPVCHFKNTYELLNLRALKCSPVNKIFILQCMGKIFCVEFQRYPLIFRKNIRFKSSYAPDDVSQHDRWNLKKHHRTSKLNLVNRLRLHSMYIPFSCLQWHNE